MKNVFRLLFLLILFPVLLPTASGTDRKLAFERNNEIWISMLDGKAAKKIADGNLPDISPDGSKIAFTTDDSTEGPPVRHIAIYDLVNAKVVSVPNIPSKNSFGPVWSPDSKDLLFSTYLEDDWQIAFIHSDGTGFQIVKKAEKQHRSYFMPVWSADGKSFFSHDLDFIYQCSLDGTLLNKWEIRKIIENGEMNSNSRMSVSPDDKLLLMDIDMAEDQEREDWDGPPPALWVFDLSKDHGTRLTPKDFFAWEPSWISSEEFLFMSQGVKEEITSIYRGKLSSKEFQRVLKNGRTPTASK